MTCRLAGGEGSESSRSAREEEGPDDDGKQVHDAQKLAREHPGSAMDWLQEGRAPDRLNGPDLFEWSGDGDPRAPDHIRQDKRMCGRRYDAGLSTGPGHTFLYLPQAGASPRGIGTRHAGSQTDLVFLDYTNAQLIPI